MTAHDGPNKRRRKPSSPRAYTLIAAGRAALAKAEAETQQAQPQQAAPPYEYFDYLGLSNYRLTDAPEITVNRFCADIFISAERFTFSDPAVFMAWVDMCQAAAREFAQRHAQEAQRRADYAAWQTMSDEQKLEVAKAAHEARQAQEAQPDDQASPTFDRALMALNSEREERGLAPVTLARMELDEPEDNYDPLAEDRNDPAWAKAEAMLWDTARALSADQAQAQDDDEDDEDEDNDDDEEESDIGGYRLIQYEDMQRRALLRTIADIQETVTAPQGDIWAALSSKDYVILDTETTGLGADAQIVEIAIIDQDKRVIFCSLIDPERPIPAEASAIHGIKNEDVKFAPTFLGAMPEILQAIRGRHVIVYNAQYDRRLLHQSAEAAGLPKVDYKTFSTWHCAMETFAPIYGAWSSYHHSYTWQPLSKAVRHYGGNPENAHRALADCEMTHFICQAMLKAHQAKADQS